MIASGNGKTAILEEAGVTLHRKSPRGAYFDSKFIPFSAITSVSLHPAGVVLPGRLSVEHAGGTDIVDYLVQQADLFEPLHDALKSKIA